MTRKSHTNGVEESSDIYNDTKAAPNGLDSEGGSNPSASKIPLVLPAETPDWGKIMLEII